MTNAQLFTKSDYPSFRRAVAFFRSSLDAKYRNLTAKPQSHKTALDTPKNYK